MPKQVYDIRTSEAAFSTLVNLTGVSKSIWEKYCIEESRTDNILEQLTYIIESHGHFQSSPELCVNSLSYNQATDFLEAGLSSCNC